MVVPHFPSEITFDSRSYARKTYSVPRVPLLICFLTYVAGFTHGVMTTNSRPCVCNVSVSQKDGDSEGSDSREASVVPRSQVHQRSEGKKETSYFDSIRRGFCENPSTKPVRVIDDDIEHGFIKPFERTPEREFLPGHTTDAFTYFHYYLSRFGRENPESPLWKFRTFPLLHIWPNFFEAYHNHWQRYRGKDVVFMEIGVQSGGKIAMLRDYFGPGFKYVGIDVNPSCKMFESADFVSIEIGDSEKRPFLESIKKKYPRVDIFLDDGGHTMNQQRTAMELMFPHVKDDGIYMCEDLNTSWNANGGFQGKRFSDERDEYFRENTMMGLVHRSIDWLHYGWIGGRTGKPDDPDKFENFWPERWWKNFAASVKHVHIYNQIVVYEKGQTEIFTTKTIGYQLPIKESGDHPKVDWKEISSKIASYTGSEWKF